MSLKIFSRISTVVLLAGLLAVPALAGEVSVSWDPSDGATSYTVYRGMQRNASDLACFLPAELGTSADDDGLQPAPGVVLYYLTTAVNCGGESTLGSGRSASPCP